ncbi:hypothetical protein HYX02_04665 [Candidatus Woesearchaeota archaeon]|nr:hypothetical protein [Candidatus Woesearchaeota archaeon]
MSKMKTYNLFFIVFVGFLFFIVSCTNQPKEDIEFKQMCQGAGYEWMLMKPTQDGKFIKDAEQCWGCMIEGIEHVCSMEKFEKITGNMESDMPSMQHMAMTAHAGTRNSVDIHLYKVGFIRPDVQPGKEALLKFTINDIQSKKPVSNLEVIHDKIMHIVLVRDDLKHFDHVHPKMVESGGFAVPYEFLASGLYRIWIDFTIDGMQHIVDFDINVPGDVESEEKNLLDGIKVNFLTPNEIFADKEIELKFEIFDKNNKPVPITEKFLAADAHLISIDKSLEEFEHNHDEKFDKDNKISFIHAFEKAGKHKIWIQFSVGGRTKTANSDVAVK